MIGFLKKNFIAVLLSALFVFVVIWVGNTVSVITSRQILEPVTVSVSGLNEDDLSSVKILATLSRAGNTVNLARVPNQPNEWNNLGQAFIQKIVFGLKKEHLDKFNQVTINIGENKFIFTREQFLTEWRSVTFADSELYRSISPNLFDQKGNSDYLIYVAPDNVAAKPLTVSIPMVSRLFASINFGGSEKLIKQPLVIGLKLFFLVEVVMLIFFLILRRKNDADVGNNDVVLHKRKFIVFGLSIIITFLLLFVFNVLLAYFYQPDTSQLLISAAKIYRDASLPCFLPEPTERLQFVLSVLLSLVLLLISYKWLNKYIDRLTESTVGRLYYFLSITFPLIIFAIAYIGLAVSNFLYVSSSYSFGGIGTYLYSLMLFPIGVCVMFSLKMEKNKLFKILVYLFSGLLITTISVINIFGLNSDSLIGTLSITPHFNSVFYPMAQIMAGKMALINLTSLYGLSFVFFVGLFKLVGFSVLSFTTLMGLLIGLSYLFIFIFLHRLIKSKFILFLGFSTIIFYFFANGSMDTPSRYFQYWPIRVFFPCLVLMLASFYFKNKKKILYFLISLISALAVLWNMDSGIIVFVSWIITLAYCEIFNTNKKIIVRNIIFHIFFSLLMLGFVFFGYSAYTFLNSGLLPNLSLLSLYQNLFLSGAMMIPMPFPHVWLLVAIIFMIGLLLSIKGWCNKDKNYRNIAIFFLSIMGIGLFSYYQGRSHDHTFFGPLYIALVLLVVLADLIFQDSIVNKKLYGSGLLCLTVLFFIFSSPINIVANVGKYYSWTKTGLNAFADKTETLVTRNVDFIKKHTEKGEEIIILSEYSYDGLYYGESGTRSALDLPALTDVIFRREVDYAVELLRCNYGYKLFFYPFVNREKDLPSKYYFYDERIIQILKDDYVVVDKNNDDMVLLTRKGTVPEDCGVPKLKY